MKQNLAVVTGGMGFIGLHLVQRLLDDGWDEIIIVDDFSTHDKVSYKLDKRITLRGCSVQDILYPIGNANIVYHLAGKVGPLGVLWHAGHIADDTIRAASVAASWAELSGCVMVDISTSEVYGSPDEANREDTPAVFRSQSSARKEYAVSKLAAETMLLNRRDLDVRIVRPFNVTGARQRPEGGFVLPRFAIQALSGRPLTVYQPGNQRRAFTHVSDIVDGIIRVGDMGKSHETYNLGNPANVTSITQLALDVIDIAGRGTFSIVDPKTLHGDDFVEAPEKIPNADKAIKELGWYPVVGRRAIVNEVVEYWRQHPI